MTVAGYTVAPGFLDPGRRWPCFNLLDTSGKIVGQSTDREGIGDLIVAKQLAALIARNLANVGLQEASHARYQCAEDAFNDPDGMTEE